ncbi:MAG: 23S rRNA (adenine(2503)-C(2))-methyltransferase RlmN [Patescibacteria group bacterium]|nr:23S rRNA (adenine(2503)-C(2))-methyltransferase RlmN [Patescibacteria group bacterium]
MFYFEQAVEILRGEPKYRLNQMKQAVFIDLIDDWQKATILPAELREKLARVAPLEIDAKMHVSRDQGTVKALVELADGLKIETVLLQHEDERNTVCVSSQVGCPLACLFCATGRMGLRRDLNPGEIVGQVILFSRYLKKSGGRITNLVFMGMGEPFLNYDNVMAAINILRDKDGLNIGVRRFSISTAGVVPGIRRFTAEDTDINLAISLHAAMQEKRVRLMPIAKKYPLDELMAEVAQYAGKTRRKVMFEYLMIDGVNDTDEDARALARLMNNPLYFVNLIRFNPTGNFLASKAERIKAFKEILAQAGVNVTQRWSFGQDIEAACGQLAGKC